jgi:hypothetical protein
VSHRDEHVVVDEEVVGEVVDASRDELGRGISVRRLDWGKRKYVIDVVDVVKSGCDGESAGESGWRARARGPMQKTVARDVRRKTRDAVLRTEGDLRSDADQIVRSRDVVR